MNNASLLTLLLCVFVCTCGRAQLSVSFAEDADAALSTKLSTAEKNMIAAAVRAKLANYERLLKTVIDEDSGEFNRERALEFSALFAPGSTILDDLAENISNAPIPLELYLKKVENCFVYEGLVLRLNTATITKVDSDEDHNIFRASVLVNKSMGRYYTQGCKLEEGEKNKDFNFLFSLPSNNPEGIRIRGISPPQIAITADYNQYLSLNLGYGAGSSLESTNDNFTLDAGSELSFGVGILTNSFSPVLSKEKDLFLNADLAVFQRTVNGNLNNFTSAPAGASFNVFENQDPVTGVTVERYGTEINVTEEQRFTGLRLSLGPAFRIYNKEGNAAFVSVQYAPSFLLSGSGSLNGSGRYELRGSGAIAFNTADIPVSESFRSAFNLGNDTEANGRRLVATPELTTSTTHGIRLGASFLKDLSSGFGLGIALDYYLPLSNAWESPAPATGSPFSDPENAADLDPGTIGIFTQDPKLGFVGIRLKVFQKNTRIATPKF